MSIASCSIKFLKVAYIGLTVRLTGGKDTVKFDNKPLKDVIISNYDPRGFELKHPDLPKAIWVHFGQLPLKELTIVNGVIKDEITFVENIVSHQTEFVKTDSEEYKTALNEFQLDSKLKLLSPTKLSTGDIVISAQCKESIELFFLGVFFSKLIEPVYPMIKNSNSYSYSKFDYTQEPYFRITVDPIEQRAYFLRKHEIDENIHETSSFLPKELKDLLMKKFPTPPLDWKKPQEEREKERNQRKKIIQEEIASWCEKEKIDCFWELVRYPITNKYVKEMLVIGHSNEHQNHNVNQTLINAILNPKFFTGGFSRKTLLSHTQYFIHEYHYRDCFKSYVHDNKNEIIEKAEEFLKWYYPTEREWMKK